MTLTPDEVAQIVTAVVTLLGVLAVYLKQQSNHTDTTVATKVIDAKVDLLHQAVNNQISGQTPKSGPNP